MLLSPLSLPPCFLWGLHILGGGGRDLQEFCRREQVWGHVELAQSWIDHLVLLLLGCSDSPAPLSLLHRCMCMQMWCMRRGCIFSLELWRSFCHQKTSAGINLALSTNTSYLKTTKTPYLPVLLEAKYQQKNTHNLYFVALCFTVSCAYMPYFAKILMPVVIKRL